VALLQFPPAELVQTMVFERAGNVSTATKTAVAKKQARLILLGFIGSLFGGTAIPTAKSKSVRLTA